MSAKKLLVVVGATGTQGSSVISHFLSKEPEYAIRGLTRNVKSAKAVALSNEGVEMVPADFEDLSSLKAAFKGANAIFAYTDSAAASSSNMTGSLVESGKAKSIPEAAGQVEEQHGRNVADAAAATPTLERLVFSSAQDPAKISNGKYSVYELASKANTLSYMRSLPQLEGKVNGVVFTMFTEGIVRNAKFYGWQKTGENSYSLRVPFMKPEARVPWVDMQHDAGSYVAALLKAPAGLNVAAYTEYRSFVELVEPVKTKYGLQIDIGTVSEDDFCAGDETGLMQQVFKLHSLVEEFGVGEDLPDVLKPKDLRDRGYSVSQSSLLDSVKNLDWEHIL